MPRGDRTGPQGNGSQDGRQLGYCAGYNVPGYAQGNFSGCGLGRGRALGGRGMAVRHGAAGRGGRSLSSDFNAVPPSFSSVNEVKSQINAVEQSLDELKRKLQAMENQKED